MQDDIVEFRHSQKNYRVKSFQGYVYSGVMYVLMMDGLPGYVQLWDSKPHYTEADL